MSDFVLKLKVDKLKDNLSLIAPYESNLKKKKISKEKLWKKKIEKKKPFPFTKILNDKISIIDINTTLNVNKINDKYEYNFRGGLKTKPNNWEIKWAKIENCLEFSHDIWIKNWIRLSDPVYNNRPEYKKEISKKEIPKFYKCKFPECNKIFPDSGNLKKHYATHGEKQFICPVEGCGKKFLDKSKLKRHNLVHSGEKPYKCEICLKRFSLDFNLKTHLRTHTGLKPYICRFPGCSKKFTQSSNLVAHEKVHNRVEGPDGEVVKKKRGPPKKNPDQIKPKKEPGEKSKRGRKRKVDIEKQNQENLLKEINLELAKNNLENNDNNIENNDNNVNNEEINNNINNKEEEVVIDNKNPDDLQLELN